MEPINYSRYKHTGNYAIDLVAQCVGFHEFTNRPLYGITLKPASFDLMVAGLRVLLDKKGVDPGELSGAEITFSGVPIRKGSHRQFETMICDYHKPKKEQLWTNN